MKRRIRHFETVPIWVVSGATGGHLYPAISTVLGLNESAQFFVSRSHPAVAILKPYSWPIRVLSGWGQIMRWVVVTMGRMIIRGQRPRVILLMGGGICVPFAIMGWVWRIPMIAFEQNTIPGRANRINQWLVSAMITAFPSTVGRLRRRSHVHCLGNPIRMDDSTVHGDGWVTGCADHVWPSEWVTDSGITKTLLVIGGSQGARDINQWVTDACDDLLNDGVNIIHLTGANHMASIQHRYMCHPKTKAQYVAIAYVDSMAPLYEMATHVLCRTGATTLTELMANGLPGLLVPFPHSTDNHQYQNAIEYSAMMPNSMVVSGATLSVETVIAFLNDPKYSPMVPIIQPTDVLESVCAFVQSYLR